MDNPNSGLLLLCRVQALFCAIPLAHVIETMRPLPIDALPGTPAFLLGVALIRGLPTPVIDAACLLESRSNGGTRLVLLKVDGRQVALMVDHVEGIRALAADSLQALPPLFKDSTADVVSAIGNLDSSLMVVLESTRLIPDDLWASLDVIRDDA